MSDSELPDPDLKVPELIALPQGATVPGGPGRGDEGDVEVLFLEPSKLIKSQERINELNE